MSRPAVLRIDIIGSAAGLRRELASSDSALGKFGRGVGQAGKAIALGLAGIAVAAVGAAVAVIGSASEQQQAIGGLNSVYGKNAAQVEAWADGAAQSVGLSKTAYASLSTIVGSQLKNMGRSTAESAVQSNELIKVGADLAATYGGSVADAVGAVSSLLKGETDPIERYGVGIKQSDVNARLAAQGLGKLTGAALTQASATARLELLTKQTSSAHGQFGREADTLSGKQARLTASVENLKAKLGTALLPAASAVFGFLAKTALPAAQRLGDQLAAKLAPAAAKVGEFLQSKVMPAARSLAGVFTKSVVPALSAVGRFVSVVVLPAFIGIATFIATKMVPVWKSTLTPILAGVKSLFSQVAAAVEKNKRPLADLGTAVMTVGTFMQRTLLPVVGKVVGILGTALGAAISIAIGAISGIVTAVQGVSNAFQDAWNWVSKVGDKISSLPKMPDLNPFGGVELTGGVGSLGGLPSFAPRDGSLSTSSLTDALSLGFTTSTGSRGGVYVDRRDFRTFLRVDGALDGPAVATQLQGILDKHAARLGRTPAASAL